MVQSYHILRAEGGVFVKEVSVLFVCLGNICRSPLAEGIARHMAKESALELLVDSAGTSNFRASQPPCEGSISVALKRGIDISALRSRQVCSSDDWHDLIVAMDEQNYQDLLAMGFLESKVRKLGHFGLNGLDIPDPYHFRNGEGFERVYGLIEQGVKNLLATVA